MNTVSIAVKEDWIRNTCRIINDRGSGTGFLLKDDNKRRLYLVTNKHVIHPKKHERSLIREIQLDINIKDDSGTTKRDQVSCLFDDNSWREHDNPDTDVYILDVTMNFIDLIKRYNTKPNQFGALIEYLSTYDTLKRNEIRITDEVFIIGYPSTNNLQHHTSNFPFVRQGIISSNIGELLEDEFQGDELEEDKNKPVRKRIMKAFLIDGGVIPGLSGAPAILKPTLFRERKEAIVSETVPPMILGVVAQTRMIFLTKKFSETYYGYANLGIAFDSETILETLKLF